VIVSRSKCIFVVVYILFGVCQTLNTDRRASIFDTYGSYYILVCMTRYGLDGPGIESRWRQGFPHRSRG